MSLFRRISNLFWRSKIEREIADELTSHIQMRTADNIAAGMTPEEARRAALVRFGNPAVIGERIVAVDSGLGVEKMLWDLRYAVRQFQRNPGFALTVIGTIALGIGATVGVFSVVHSVLLQPLPYTNPDRLIVAYGDMRKRHTAELPFSSPDFMDLRNSAKTMFEGFAGVRTSKMLLGRNDGGIEQIRSAAVTTNFFQLLGGRLILGRDFHDSDAFPQTVISDPTRPAEAALSSAPPAILSYEYWQRRYGGNPAVIGQRLSSGAEGGPEIVGVLAPGFELLFPPKADVDRFPDVWIATRPTYDAGQRNTLMYRVIGRLRNGVSLANAQSEADGIAAGLRRNFPLWQTSDYHIELRPMHQYLVAELKPSILALMGAAGFLLLIACANVANVLLVRMSLRERELAVRTALGGGRWDLMRQLLAEAILLAGAGTLLGLALAWAGLHALSNVASQSQPLLASIGITPVEIGFGALFGLAAAALFGIGPALHVSRPALMTVLRTSGQNSLLAGGRLLRNGVVITEIALSFALLVGAGLMLRSFVKLQNIDPGFDARGLLTFQVLYPQQATPEERDAFLREIHDSLGSIPGVQAVTGATPFPLADQFFPIRWGTEQALSDSSRFQSVNYQVILPGYFETLKTPLLAGRTFTDSDNAPQRNLVIIDQFLAAKAFPHQSAIGKRILIRLRTPEPEWVEVIGVVAHQRDTSLAETGREELYLTDGFMGHSFATRWAIRTSSDPAKYESLVRSHIAQLGGQIALTEVQPMESLVAQAQATTRLALLLIGVFALAAALLSTLGIYGVLSTSVRQRTSEIGVRMALGATRGGILSLIVGQGLRLGVIGIVLGCGVTLGLTRWIASLLVETRPTDPLTFTGITVAFFVIVAMASWLPARRAASIDPIRALRSE
ncbi:MAG: ABC transporter permease [Acidobacteriaceae bacterium]